MGKKFREKLCVYCLGERATTEDHVFSRKFFLEKDRDNLPKAPACEACNSEKSRLEHYLTAVLPIGGRHAQALANLESGVPARLAKNRALNRNLLGSVRPGWIRRNGGIYQPTRVVEFDGPKLEGLLKFVGRGLGWHHWKVYLRPDDDAVVMFMPDMSTVLFQSLISDMRPAQRVEENLGNGTVEYVGIQAADPPQLMIWTISMYGGLVLSDDRQTAAGEAVSCCTWWVITGPRELTARLARLTATVTVPDARA